MMSLSKIGTNTRFVGFHRLVARTPPPRKVLYYYYYLKEINYYINCMLFI